MGQILYNNMVIMKLNVKKDEYKSARGWYSRFLDIYCKKCENKLLIYQKDWSGVLKRIYLDRIFSPEELKDLQSKGLNKIDNLQCKNCWEILWIPYIYEKENRKAFRLFVDAVVKKVRKGNT